VPWGVRRVAFVRCGSTGRSRGGGVCGLVVWGLFVVRAGSGDQYEEVGLVCGLGVFLGVLRGLATALCWTLAVLVGAVLCRTGIDGLRVGIEPNLAERRTDIVE
jgi:hypothetical protein